jgi:hypothetical protein
MWSIFFVDTWPDSPFNSTSVSKRGKYGKLYIFDHAEVPKKKKKKDLKAVKLSVCDRSNTTIC